MPFKPTSAPRGFRSWAAAGATPSLAEVPRRDLDAQNLDDIQEMLAQAREEGAADARAEIEAELVQLRELVDHVGPLVEDLETLRRQTLDEAAQGIADIVQLFAHRVVGDAIAMNPDALSHLIQKAIAELPEQEALTIAVSADVAETVGRGLPQKLRDRVVVDEDLATGAVVRTAHASLDATLAAATRGLDAATEEWLKHQWWVEDGSHS